PTPAPMKRLGASLSRTSASGTEIPEPCLIPTPYETLNCPMVLHFLIRGRVQGVGFRWFVHREASELGLLGWVRNTDTGDVELIASGPPEDLDELRAELKKGSRGSRVDKVIEHELDESEAASLKDFEIQGAW